MINTGRNMGNLITINEEDLVTIARFTSKVTAMRNAQRKYFKERNHSALMQSKALEHEVDLLLMPASEASKKIHQTLFNS